MQPLSIKLSIKNQRGSIAILTVFIIAALLMITVSVQEDLQKSKAQRFYKDFNEFALETAAQSGFKLMEAALRRRLWEMPPDENCNKSESVELSSKVTSYLDVEVSAQFDPINKLISLTSKGTDTRTDKTLTLMKVFKVYDASDYLLYSKGGEPNPEDNRPLTLHRTGPNSVAALIAGPRRVYTENPVSLQSTYFAPSTHASDLSSPSSSPPHHFLGTIIQGERMTFIGGIQYAPEIGNPFSAFSQPIPSYVNSRRAALGLEELYPKVSEYGAVVTSDFEAAQQMAESVKNNGSPSFPPAATYINNIYPFSLFCGTPPLIADDGADTGCYNNGFNDRYSNRYDDDVWNTVRVIDLFCASAKNDDGKNCSNSLDFPKGFEKWRTDAGLENILYTEPQEKLELKTLSWDHLDSLKEDAQLCGQYISSHTSSYEDCDIADRSFLNRYISNPSEGCGRFSRIDLNPNSFPHFNASFYANPANKDRWLRRVIYSEVPVEVSQSSPNGLATSLANNNTRKNMPLWIVSPDVIRLKPYQQDTSSPTTTNPSQQREVFFNKPYNDSISTESLKLVLLSPESINVVSPFHQPMTKSQLTYMYPIVSGRIKPRFSVYTDHIHQENDGFRYGARTLNFKNMVVISNQNPSVSFALTGLWHGYDQLSVHQVLSGFCMLSDPSIDEAPFAILNSYSRPYSISDNSVPSYADNSAPNLFIPPRGSRFYNGNRLDFHPYVFQRQYYNGKQNTSQINFEGLRIFAGFSPSDPPLRDLSSPSRSRGHIIGLPQEKMDISDRHYTWSDSKILQTTTDSPCSSVFLKSGGQQYLERKIAVSDGLHSFAQKPVDPDFNAVGSFNAREMITIKVR